MANQTLVFVHGSDPKQADTPWMFYHLHPSNYSQPVSSESKVFDLVYFDYETGTRKEWKNWTATRSRTAPGKPTAEGEILPAPEVRDAYGNPYDPPRRRPSVEAFYRWVKIQPKGSIASIQIFSHATILQPVLFPESFEWGDNVENQADVTAPRDPRDTEFRLRDFEGNNPLSRDPDPWSGPISGEIEKFRNALAPDVFIKIWGCGENTPPQNDGPMYRKYLTDYLKAKPGKAGDVDRASALVGYLFWIRDYFPYRLAERLHLPVWGGPLGYGTEPFDIDGAFNRSTYQRDKYTWTGKFPANLEKKEWWWRASHHFRRDPRLANVVFKRALKAKVDGLGYIEYKKSWVDAADRAAQAVLNPPRTPGQTAPTLPSPQDLMNGVLDQMRRMGLGSTEE